MSSSSRLSSGRSSSRTSADPDLQKGAGNCALPRVRARRPGAEPHSPGPAARRRMFLSAAPPVIESHDRHVRELQRDLATILDTPALRHGVLAVSVRSLTRGDQLFRYHADTLVMPASNMKLVTLAVAAERLGWDFTFETTIVSTGSLDAMACSMAISCCAARAIRALGSATRTRTDTG